MNLDFIAEMETPANRSKLWFGVWTGYVVALGFALLALATVLFDLTPYRWAFLWLVSVKLLTTSLAALALVRDRWVLQLQAISLVADTLLLTAAIYFTGGPYSPLVATYVILISALSLLTNLGITVLMASFIALSFSTMVVLLATGVLPPTPVPGSPGMVPSPGYAFTAIVFCLVVVGVPAAFGAATLRLLRGKEADLERRTAQLIRAATQRSQFVASMTHELRTPIHGVQGLSDVIAAGVYGPVTDKQKEACASIKRSAQSLLGLVDDVLQLTRAEAGKIDARPAMVNLTELVERVTASVWYMVGTKNLRLETAVEPNLPRILSDERWLAHILVNLIANAVKFTPDGGLVRVLAHQRGDVIELAVEDSGIGIAPEDREAIFEPFRQGERGDERGYGGVGLGLALVAKLAELLGAKVELESELGKGSTFRLLVPNTWRGRKTAQLVVPPRPATEELTRLDP
ncbi:MAG: HAMP domain-containing histidine kinase [Myxococcota bacterium]|nr:HAMP domain-containing histidine kinase [Myxococcota bacterium]